MSDLATIRDAIKTTLETAVSGLTVYDTVPDATNLPALVTVPVSADFNVAMGRGADTWQLDLYVMVSTADMGLGQDALDGFVSGAGATSIRAAVWASRSLGLPDVDATVTDMSNYGANFAQSSIQHIGAVLRLTVQTSGKA